MIEFKSKLSSSHGCLLHIILASLLHFFQLFAESPQLHICRLTISISLSRLNTHKSFGWKVTTSKSHVCSMRYYFFVQVLIRRCTSHFFCQAINLGYLIWLIVRLSLLNSLESQLRKIYIQIDFLFGCLKDIIRELPRFFRPFLRLLLWLVCWRLEPDDFI